MKQNIMYIITLLTFIIVLSNINQDVVFANNNEEIEIFSLINPNEDNVLEKIETLATMTIQNQEIVKVLEAITVYNSNTKQIFYLYPIYINEICTYIAEVDETYNVVLSENINVWNSIQELTKGQYIIYVNNGIYYAQNLYESIILYETGLNINNENSNFFELTYEEKQQNILCCYEEHEGVYIDIRTKKVIDVINTLNTRSVVSGYEGSRRITHKCSISNFVNQGSYQLCWAAAVATIVNYKTGSSLSATYFADKYHIGYNMGATLEQSQKCLTGFGLNYTLIDTKLSWSKIKTNIDNDKPFVIRLYASGVGGHQITGYGYGAGLSDTVLGYRTIYAWDPNGYNISFLDSDTKIVTSGYSFVWNRTLY